MASLIERIKKLLKWLINRKVEHPDLLTELTLEKVQEIQTAHNKWCESQHKQGTAANFKRCDLPKEARFAGGNYEGVSFRGAYLRGIIFKGSKLLDCDFREANLQDTDFSEAQGLNLDSISGADVSNSILPEGIRDFKTLEELSEAARNARKLFAVMLLACVYSVVTIATTTDVRLITNSASSPLPIIGAEIPIVGFFWVMPLFLLGLFIYFHLNMQRIWEELAKLPAIFPDGIPLDQKIYPWLLLDLTRNYFSLLKVIRPPMHRLQTLISSFLGWWVVPLSLILLWLRFIPRHDWWGTGLHVSLITITIWLGWKFHRICVQTLRWGEIAPIHSHKKTPKRLSELAFTFFGMSFFLLFSYGAINGNRPLNLEPVDIESFIPWVLERFAFGAFADLVDAEVSTRPPGWTGLKEKEKEELAQVKGAQLVGANLQHADANGAFLVKADFSNADLESANLRNADLRHAILKGVNLRNADLEEARLRNADLRDAILKGVNLRDADLKRASLNRADLTDAQLNSANLYNADLSNADLRRTILVGANLNYAILDSADLFDADLRNTRLIYASLVGANLSDANLDSANLRSADLSNENLGNTSLVGANLSYARLDSTDLQSADLRGADLLRASLRRANLPYIKNWRDIKDMRLANIWGVVDPPEGFLAWADSMGAVSFETDEEWEYYLEQVNASELP